MRNAVRLVVCLVLALVALAPSAHAGPDDDRKAAEKLTQDGLQLARSKQFREAIAKFEAAQKLFPRPEIQHNLARAHEELGELKLAYDLYSQALKQDYPFAADGRTRLAAIDAELRKSYGRLTVRTTPSQVAVVLTFPDGSEEKQNLSPFATWVPAGRTKIVGTNPNFRTKEDTVDIAAGADSELQLTLQPLPKQGFLVVRVNIAGATISLAGQPLGKSPLDSVTYEAGVYQLDVRARGYAPHTQEVIIVQDEVATVNVSLVADATVAPTPTSDGVPSWVGWTLVSVGAVAGGAALYLQLGVARPAQADANALPPPTGGDDSEYDRLHQKAQRYQTAAIVSGIVGGVVAATGAYLLIFESPDDTSDAARAPRVVPSFAVSPDGAGVGATLTF